MPTKDEEASTLAQIHYEVEPGMTHIYRVKGTEEREALPSEPIKLLEVNEHTVPSGILPLRFGPSPHAGLIYSCVIMEVTPEEFAQIESDHLTLPHDWSIADLIPREPARLEV